jgi:hypothetical protein
MRYLNILYFPKFHSKTRYCCKQLHSDAKNSFINWFNKEEIFIKKNEVFNKVNGFSLYNSINSLISIKICGKISLLFTFKENKSHKLFSYLTRYEANKLQTCFFKH